MANRILPFTAGSTHGWPGRVSRTRRLLALLALALLPAPPLAGQDFVIGLPVPDGANCAPFICLSKIGGIQWQQLYWAGEFGEGPFNISGLYFFSTEYHTWDGGFDGGRYRVSLSTVPTALDAFVAGNAPIPLGANDTDIFTGYLSGPVPSGTALHLVFQPFLYDPGAGNLLLNVDVVEAGTPILPPTYFDVYSSCQSTAAAGSTGSTTWAACDAALVTGFDLSPVATTPEPASLALLATGLAGVTAALRRRRRPPA